MSTTRPLIDEGRQLWPRGSQERGVESFYQHGVEHYADYHGGMLNFGLWTGEVRDYRTASKNLMRRVAASIGLEPESRLLDVGCGMGAQDVLLADELGCRSIDGLDVTWKHVVTARERAKTAGVEDRVRFHHGTAVALPFPDSSFTHVLSVEGAEHFDTRERFLHEAFRVLVSGGRIALTDFSMSRPPRTTFERLFAELARRGWHVPRENVDTAEGFRAKIGGAGFRDVRIEEGGEEVIPGYYREGRKPENIRAMYAIRGVLVTHVGLWIDALVYHLFRRGILEYVFVTARKR